MKLRIIKLGWSKYNLSIICVDVCGSYEYVFERSRVCNLCVMTIVSYFCSLYVNNFRFHTYVLVSSRTCIHFNSYLTTSNNCKCLHHGVVICWPA